MPARMVLIQVVFLLMLPNVVSAYISAQIVRLHR